MPRTAYFMCLPLVPILIFSTRLEFAYANQSCEELRQRLLFGLHWVATTTATGTWKLATAYAIKGQQQLAVVVVVVAVAVAQA